MTPTRLGAGDDWMRLLSIGVLASVGVLSLVFLGTGPGAATRPKASNAAVASLMDPQRAQEAQARVKTALSAAVTKLTAKREGEGPLMVGVRRNRESWPNPLVADGIRPSLLELVTAIAPKASICDKAELELITHPAAGSLAPNQLKGILTEPAACLLLAVCNRQEKNCVVQLILENSQKVLAREQAVIPQEDVLASAGHGDFQKLILDYSRSQMGKQVGNGECWTLAAEAMNAAGTRPPIEYNFGRELKENEVVIPGDIIQFTSMTFVDDRGWTWTLGLPNHTAVISAVSANRTITVFQQNVGGKKIVMTQTINLARKTGGSYQIFRVVPQPAGHFEPK
jgi:hypothetical protein